MINNFDEHTNTDLPGEIYDCPDHAYESWKEQQSEEAHREACMSQDTGFDERSLDELMAMDLQDRQRELLADSDDQKDPNG